MKPSFNTRFKHLIPRRQFDRRAVLFASVVGCVLLSMVIVLESELLKERKAHEFTLKQFRNLEKGTCPAPKDNKERVISWRDSSETVRCQTLIPIETVVGK
jgi:hypothetical protein